MVPSIGVNLRVTGHCNQGGRKYMEDAFAVAYQQTKDETDLEYAYFGIFDGHGGREAALFAKEHLMDYIVSQKGFWSDDDESVLKAIKDGFVATHMAMWKEVGKWPRTLSGLPSTSGSTASVVFIRKGKLYIGHVGDSAVVLGYKETGEEHFRARPLTRDHKPESPVEKSRIETVGGAVMSKSGVQRVVWNRPHLGHQGPIRRSTRIDQIPFLAVARSLGDLWSYDYFHGEFIVSPEPDVSVVQLDPTKDRCIVLASDGLWNMMSGNSAVQTVENADRENERHVLEEMMSGGSKKEKAWINPSKLLVEKAIDSWYRRRMRADNTSVVTVMLDPPGPPRSEVLMRQHMLKKLRPREDLDSTSHQDAERRESRILVASTPTYMGSRGPSDREQRQTTDEADCQHMPTKVKSPVIPDHSDVRHLGHTHDKRMHIRILKERRHPSYVLSSSSRLPMRTYIHKREPWHPVISHRPNNRNELDGRPISPRCSQQQYGTSRVSTTCDSSTKAKPIESSVKSRTSSTVIAAADSTQPSPTEELDCNAISKETNAVACIYNEKCLQSHRQFNKSPRLISTKGIAEKNVTESCKRLKYIARQMSTSSVELQYRHLTEQIHQLQERVTHKNRDCLEQDKRKLVEMFKQNQDLSTKCTHDISLAVDTDSCRGVDWTANLTQGFTCQGLPHNVPTSTTTDMKICKPPGVVHGFSSNHTVADSPCHRCVRPTRESEDLSYRQQTGQKYDEVLAGIKRRRVSSTDEVIEQSMKRVHRRGQSWTDGCRPLRLLRRISTRSKLRQRKECS